MLTAVRFSMFALLAAVCAAPTASAELDDPVESGREALDPRSEYPWYDAEADDVRPVTLRSKPKEVQGESDGSTTTSPKSATAGAEVVAWVIVGVVVVALIGVLLYAVLQSDVPPAKQRGKKSDDDGVDLAALPVPVAAADSDLLAEARRWYERGDFGRAMIYLYSHLLLRLDKGQLIRLAKGKTNRQYLREVGGRRSLAEYFETAMHAFESAFFGRRALPRDEFELAWRGVDDFHRMIEEAHA